LRDTVEWSYGLLSPSEQRLFVRLSVFVGGRTIEAAEAVCDPTHELDETVFDGVDSLVEKSLLRQEEGPAGEPRFLMLETIRDYALERLEESGEGELLRDRHAHYFVALAEQAEPEILGADQVVWLERLEAERDNFRAALGWLLERPGRRRSFSPITPTAAVRSSETRFRQTCAVSSQDACDVYDSARAASGDHHGDLRYRAQGAGQCLGAKN
jgi:predicted ATPase